MSLLYKKLCWGEIIANPTPHSRHIRHRRDSPFQRVCPAAIAPRGGKERALIGMLSGLLGNAAGGGSVVQQQRKAISGMEWEAELALAKAAALEAGTALRLAFSQSKTILSEHGRDIKLQADQDAEKIILEHLQQSRFPVLAEESGEHGDIDATTPCWVVDPLDGTMNFSRTVSLCCVSIALTRGEAPLLGVVYHFMEDDLYVGAPGHGAWWNDRPMHVSEIRDSSKGILSTGFPNQFNFEGPELAAMMENLRRFKKIRMIGSAALSLAFVASGRFDAYAEDSIMFWDVAAGLALVEAAGGAIAVEAAGTGKWTRKVRAACTPALFL